MNEDEKGGVRIEKYVEEVVENEKEMMGKKIVKKKKGEEGKKVKSI